MLTPFQQEVAQLLPHLPEAEGFALAGGAALIVRDMIDRETRDLDFFGPEAASVNLLAPAFEHAARQAGMAVARTFDAPGFVRFEVTRGQDRCEVDLGYDARLWPIQQTSLGPTIGDNEMAADKTLALFGRAAARDFLDVQALARRYGEQRLVELAAAKDLGFSAPHLAEALASIDRLDRRQFPVDDSNYQQLRDWALRWSRSLERPDVQREQHRGRRRDPSDIGLWPNPLSQPRAEPACAGWPGRPPPSRTRTRPIRSLLSPLPRATRSQQARGEAPGFRRSVLEPPSPRGDTAESFSVVQQIQPVVGQR
ncbi:MAG: nucleotidyl transferase AbiEii/AbiGii toxin family protein [Actinomycetota bacterium]|nr:nucleotidyl transferase AbiEii/AbiGii toxin family protein [Actinomycetota bacterium]